MKWRVTIYWGILALLVAAVAIVLTRWITAVHPRAEQAFAVVFEEHPPAFKSLPPNIEDIGAQSRQIPRIVVTGYNELLLVVTPATRAIRILGFTSNQFSCAAVNQAAYGVSVAGIVQAVNTLPLENIGNRPKGEISPQVVAQRWPLLANLIQRSFPITSVSIPGALQTKLRAHRYGLGIIRCRFSAPLTASPTFTDRSVTIIAPAAQSGAALLDISALGDIDDLRFFGGTVLPWEGDRTRAFDSRDQLISAEWADVRAEEKRDVFLVIIGALAAIAAATGLEAVRPIVEHLTEETY